MIISHKLKVIYIKGMKVAGSSFEIALSKYCGEDDIITPIAEEYIRRFEGFVPSQNYTGPHKIKKKALFYSNCPASKIKSLVPADVWNNYLKIIIIRCPYDQVISGYFYVKKVNWRYFNLDFPSYVAVKNRHKQLGHNNYGNYIL